MNPDVKECLELIRVALTDLKNIVKEQEERIRKLEGKECEHIPVKNHWGWDGEYYTHCALCGKRIPYKIRNKENDV